MELQSTASVPGITGEGPITPIVDQTSKGGLTLTGISFVIVGVALGVIFVWIGLKYTHNILVTLADKSFERSAYSVAIAQYTSAITLNRSDAHSYLNRGFAMDR